MKVHPKTGRTIREEAEVVAQAMKAPALSLGDDWITDMVERSIRRYASPGYNKKKAGAVVKEADQRVPDFIKWFFDAYQELRSATYVVNGGRDGALVKRLLKVVTFEQLVDCALILLDERTDDRFIQESDRGIGILSLKINWLNARRAAYLARKNGGPR